MVERNEQGSFLKIGLAEPNPKSNSDIDELLKASTSFEDNEIESQFVAALIMEFFPNLQKTVPSLNLRPHHIAIGPLFITPEGYNNITPLHEGSRIIIACPCNGGSAKDAPLKAHQLAEMTMNVLLGKTPLNHLSAIPLAGGRKKSL
jgi:hypothetical protein